MKNILTKRIMSRIAVALICSTVLFSMPIKAQSLDEAQKKQEELKNSLDEANRLIDSLKDTKDNTENSIKKIDKEIDSLEKENNKVVEEIETINSDIDSLNIQLDETKTILDSQIKDMSERIVYSYECGRSSLLNALFASKDISEFLNIMQFTIDIAKHDRKVMDEYEQTLQILSKQTDALNKKQEDAQRLERENEDRISAIEALKTAKEGELAGIDEELTDAKEIAAVYEKEMQAQNEVLSAIQAAIAAQREMEEAARREEAARKEQEQQEVTTSSSNTDQTESNNGNNSANTSIDNQTPQDTQATGNISGFVWPCPSSKRITSEFGPRQSPTEGASTNHKGIDIGAKTGADILAVQSGTVILSQYSNSAGNYIIINHGKNSQGKIICSVYMHASERFVSVGQKVERGQKIAAVGSTGYSTGPHLHFGVTEDGTYVNPWNYL